MRATFFRNDVAESKLGSPGIRTHNAERTIRQPVGYKYRHCIWNAHHVDLLILNMGDIGFDYNLDPAGIQFVATIMGFTLWGKPIRVLGRTCTDQLLSLRPIHLPLRSGNMDTQTQACTI